MHEQKLIVVSCRLPVHLQQAEAGWTATKSPGGLATALRALAADRPFTWVGWPGASVAEDEQEAVTRALAQAGDVHPVFMDESELNGFYEHASNRLLWPLFHGLPGRHNYDEAAWATYRVINERFADAVAAVARPGDTVWVHDYQLALLPAMLRERQLGCAIGFFLHIPFPAPEMYRILAVREEVLRGMLGADLIGFHDHDYAQNFRGSCLRLLGLPADPGSIVLPTHRARLAVLPIGIDPAELEEMAGEPEVVELRRELEARYRGLRVVCGVDRLDYTKGLPHKLLAFQELLRERPDLRERVVLIQIAAPSRTGVPEYQQLKRDLDELVGRINGEFGTLTWTPVVYINHNVERPRLVALYQVSDAALLTPVRDGMNLVALEYVAARGEAPGTLILSEFTGAAASLAGACRVNPHNSSEIAAALAAALERPQPDAAAFAQMRRFVKRNTAQWWAERFLQRLGEAWELASSPLKPLDFTRGRPAAYLNEARAPLIMLDYDGTLVPHRARPSEATPSAELVRQLDELSRRADVWLVSGRTAADLESWFGALDLGLVCEHGLATRVPGEGWSESTHTDLAPVREQVEALLEDFRRRVPGSEIERKTASLAWHYRTAEPDQARWQARELWSLLEEQLAARPYSVLKGSKVIEIRPIELTKRAAAQTILGRYPDADFIFCAGNDFTDEEMFEAVQQSNHPRAVLCQVGGRSTLAPYSVETPEELLAQLRLIAAGLSR